jgi:hypothetical protein
MEGRRERQTDQKCDLICEKLCIYVPVTVENTFDPHLQKHSMKHTRGTIPHGSLCVFPAVPFTSLHFTKYYPPAQEFDKQSAMTASQGLDISCGYT